MILSIMFIVLWHYYIVSTPYDWIILLFLIGMDLIWMTLDNIGDKLKNR